jgi:hypothetical protein
MLGLYAYSRYGLFMYKMHRHRLGILYGGLGSLCGPACFFVTTRLKAPVPWILLGLVVGAILDLSRRNAIRAVLMKKVVESGVATKKDQVLPQHLIDLSGSELPNPMNCPIFPDESPSVFISYAHSSEWGNQVSRQLHERLSSVGVPPFRSQDDIAEGAAWHSVLSESINGASLFVAVLDPESIRREWPAAETQQALERKHRTGCPDIFVLTSPDLHEAETGPLSWMPVFRSLLDQPEGSEDEGKVRLVEWREGAVAELVDWLGAGYYGSAAVVPRLPAAILRLIWAVPRALIKLVNLAGLPAGAALALLGLADLLGAVNVRALLATDLYLDAPYLLSAVWLGNACRLSITCVFEPHCRDRSAAFRGVSTLGCLLFVALLGSAVSLIVLCWAAVLCVLSWALAGRTLSAGDPPPHGHAAARA